MHIIILTCGAIFLYSVSPAGTIATASSSNASSLLANVTSLNQTLISLENQTAALNQTLSALNNTLSTQGEGKALSEITSLAQQQTQIASSAAQQQTQILQNTAQQQTQITKELRERTLRDLPIGLSIMLGIAIVFIIAVPVLVDLKNDKHRPDLYRALMTYAIVAIVGIVIVYLIALINVDIMEKDNPNVNALIDVLKNLSTIVGTALAAIVAFYFGAKSVKESKEAEQGQGQQGQGQQGQG